MALGKWIGGILGFMSGGPIGALAGIVLGSVFDSMLDSVNTPETQGVFEDAFDRQTGHARQTGRTRQTVMDCCGQMAVNMDYSQRLQLDRKSVV